MTPKNSLVHTAQAALALCTTSQTGLKAILRTRNLLNLAVGIGAHDPEYVRSGEQRCLRGLLTISTDSKPVMIDVGAHEGTWSSMALALSPGARILCIEPNDQNFRRLQARFSGDNRVECLPVALAREPGFGLSVGDGQRAQMVRRLTQGTGTPKSEVRILSPADLILGGELRRLASDGLRYAISEAHPLQVAIVKVDAEGFDSDIIAGFMDCRHELQVENFIFEYGQTSFEAGVTLDSIRQIFGPEYDLFRVAQYRLIAFDDLTFEARNAPCYANWIAKRMGR